MSLAAGLFVEPNPGPVLANFGVDNLRFLTPVKAGDTIGVTLTVKQITPRATADYGEVRWDAVVTNQDDNRSPPTTCSHSSPSSGHSRSPTIRVFGAVRVSGVHLSRTGHSDGLKHSDVTYT